MDLIYRRWCMSVISVSWSSVSRLFLFASCNPGDIITLIEAENLFLRVISVHFRLGLSYKWCRRCSYGSSNRLHFLFSLSNWLHKSPPLPPCDLILFVWLVKNLFSLSKSFQLGVPRLGCLQMLFSSRRIRISSLPVKPLALSICFSHYLQKHVKIIELQDIVYLL